MELNDLMNEWSQTHTYRHTSFWKLLNVLGDFKMFIYVCI